MQINSIFTLLHMYVFSTALPNQFVYTVEND